MRLDTALRYIKKWFDFFSNWLHCLPPLSLHGKLTFKTWRRFVRSFVARMNMVDLNDECATLNILIEKLQDVDRWNNIDEAARWMAVFQLVDLYTYMYIEIYIRCTECRKRNA